MIESSSGFGVLRISRDEVLRIEFEPAKRILNRRVGLGYHHQSRPNTDNPGARQYGADGLSLKLFFSDNDFLELQVGFFSASNGSVPVYEVLSTDLRYGTVFHRQALADLYYGMSIGVLNVEDNTVNPPVSGSGIRYRTFLGIELFLASVPNLGIATEIGFGIQTVDSRTVTDLSTSNFPSFSMRYYF